MAFSIVKDSKCTMCLTAVAAGSDAQYTSIIDTQNFESCTFLASFGTITSGAVTSVSIQQDDANATAGMTDLLGSGYTVADTNDDMGVIVEVIKPTKRYLRLKISRATQNAVINCVWAIQTGARLTATTHDSTTVIGSEQTFSPAEGTA